MPDSLAALVLSAGSGTRLLPLTHLRPKVLCPIAGVPLVDLALERVAAVVGAGPAHVAVNARYHVERLSDHVAGRAHVSDERTHPEELGTAGAVAALRPWLDGRAVLVVNGDTVTDVPLAPLLDGWDGEAVRVLLHGPPGTPLLSEDAWEVVRDANRDRDPGMAWRPRRVVGAARVIGSLLPAADAARLPLTPLGLSNGLWWPAKSEGRLQVVNGEGDSWRCDTPSDYLLANLAASGGRSVVDNDAVVDGRLERCVLWPGAVVHRGEALVDAIRCDTRTTVLVRRRFAGWPSVPT